MNVSHLSMCVLSVSGLAMFAGCAAEAMPDGAGEAPEQVGEAAQAVAGAALIYGQAYAIENQYATVTNVAGFPVTSKGGYLDVRGAGCEGNDYCVSTAVNTTRDGASGTWVIMSATGKPNGTPVANGDQVYLQNAYNGSGGFLDVRGAGCESNDLCVSTAVGPMRDNGSGTWKIQMVSGSSTVAEGQDVRLVNGYSSFNGGYLDTRGSGCEGNRLCVSTSSSQDRDGGSTHWQFSAAASSGTASATRVSNFFRAESSGNGAANKPEASYGRGVGAIPTTCDPGWEFIGGVCYSPCPDGYYGVGIACWQSCPSGYTDTGALCEPSDKGNKCSGDCPSGWTNWGCFCRYNGTTFAKNTINRSTTLPHCGSDKGMDAGLCYQSCDDGYVGVGPVCWLGSIGSGACQRLYDPSLANAAISQYTTMTFGVGAGVEIIAAGGGETGVIYGGQGEYGCYTQWCAGVASNISASIWGSAGLVYGSFDSAAGPSIVGSGSAGFGWVGYTSAYSVNLDGTYGGVTSELSLGKGVLPASIAGAYCQTSVTRLW